MECDLCTLKWDKNSYPHTHVRNSMSHNNHKVEATQVPTDTRWRIVQPEQGDPSPRDNWGEPRRHAKGNTPVTKERTLMWSIQTRLSQETVRGRGAVSGRGDGERVRSFTGEERPGDGRSRRLHGNGNVFLNREAPPRRRTAHLETAEMAKSMVYVFYRRLKKSLTKKKKIHLI